MSEKLCLQWNDFQDNIKSAFGNLRDDNDFADVTLACEDGQQVEAHKVILAASSPFFQNLLGRNKHSHPLIYMRGVKSDDLLAIVDFLYRGEANVYQESLDSFLAIAEELQLKGLMGKADENLMEDFIGDRKYQPPPKAFDKVINDPKILPNGQVSRKIISSTESGGTVAISNHFSGNLDELEARVRSMMEKSKNKLATHRQRRDVCKVCGKEGEGTQIKSHIEANHLDGISIPCNHCDKYFRSREALRYHMRQQKD